MISAHLLREARLRAGLTQEELGRRAGKSASAIGRWERGDVRPSLETLRALVRAADLELTFSLTPADPHDLALIRRCLALDPPERLARMVEAVRALDAMAASAARG